MMAESSLLSLSEVIVQPAENNSLISSSTNHYYEKLETIETVLLAHENSAKQTPVESFDFEGKLCTFKVESEYNPSIMFSLRLSTIRKPQ